MRNISFAATEDQILRQTKDVTRRMGWLKAKAGDTLQPVRKGMGIPKGGHVVKLGCPIVICDVRREPLSNIFCEPGGCRREGFPDMTPSAFVEFFCAFNKCNPRETVTRIEFAYTVPIKVTTVRR